MAEAISGLHDGVVNAANLPRAEDGLPPAGSTIVVAMSGGVDSSVAAALLKSAGYNVIGVTLQLYDHGQAVGQKGSCCAGQDIHDARRVASHIGIPHYVLDYESRFKQRVIEDFADSYLNGETPIPCVTCNSQIKFSELLDTAKDLGARVLATGHYIRRTDHDGRPGMFRAADRNRDQSYFLFNTSAAQLQRLIFPLGRMTKPEVRALARHFALPVAEKADSQDICFVPSGRYADVIEKLRPGAADPGDIVHVDGRVLGRHKGIINFTVGQRKGLGVALGDPLYVVRLDPKSQQVIVGPKTALEAQTLKLRGVNWLSGVGPAPVGEHEVFVRVRSSQAPQAATLIVETHAVRVILHRPEPGIAAGQACVFYAGGAEDAQVLGGGFIARTLSRSDVLTSAAVVQSYIHAKPEAAVGDARRVPASGGVSERE